MVPRSGSARHEIHVLLVKLAVIQLDFHRDRLFQLGWQTQFVVHGLARTRRNLVVVERHKNILWITTGNTIPFAIQQEHIHKVRPRIDFAVNIHPTISPDYLAPTGDRHLQPHFVRIDSALSEEMT